MVAAKPISDLDHEELDQRVIMRCMVWQDYEAMLAIRGDRAGVRLYYLDGEIEIVSPAKIHESRKKTLARLLELWALERDVSLNGFGSWTLKKELREAGAEPDECYILGDPEARERPDLAIEIEWPRTVGLPRREIYQRLGVHELWTIRRDGSLVVQVLEGEAWREVEESPLLPDLDLAWLMAFARIEPQSAAVRALRDALRG